MREGECDNGSHEAAERRSARRRGLLAALATAGYVYSTNKSPATRFRTATVDRGTIVASVSATGALAAVTTVQVGSQVSGQVREVLVDFNSLCGAAS